MWKRQRFVLAYYLLAADLMGNRLETRTTQGVSWDTIGFAGSLSEGKGAISSRYVEGLENRIQKMEKLLRKVRHSLSFFFYVHRCTCVR